MFLKPENLKIAKLEVLLLKFKTSIRMGKKWDLNYFECGMVVDVRRLV